VSNLLDLKGRVALVTGAGQGVGRQIALDLAANGARAVIVNDYYEDRAAAVAEEISAAGGRGVPVSFDVTDHEAVLRGVEAAVAHTGPVEILVNNAGNAGPEHTIFDNTPFWETGPEEWAPWIGSNFYGVLNCTRAVAAGMVERRYGRIVTIISDAGRVGEPHLVVYSGAKAGAAGFMRGLAKSVGRHGVTANCIALSAMRTPASEAAVEDPEMVKKMLRSYVIKRLGEPSDASALALFLASDAAEWITGQTYPVNGGYSVAL
jgi:2-hydroxycyclohexanecarboxyl-CoA dehydrogenase